RDAGADRERSSRADGDLHRAIAEATHNPYLVDLSDWIRRTVSLGFRAEPYTPAIREQAVVEHGDLAEAVIAGSVDRAVAVAGHHFSLTEERLRELYERTRAIGAAQPGEGATAEARTP
ncbi:MAG TPA: FCD domain-containing protein, partial [Candidatus Deferrimicrobium sp.]|nr:FCD domain-containing protein [Candidatus Deferrimicrobium sp.]